MINNKKTYYSIVNLWRPLCVAMVFAGHGSTQAMASAVEQVQTSAAEASSESASNQGGEEPNSSEERRAAVDPSAVLDANDIIVTAERRSTSLQRTAASVSIRDGSALQREGKFTLRQVLEDVPSVLVNDINTQSTAGSDTPGASVTIRGIGANAQPGAVSSVGATAIYVDGVFEGVGSSFDIDRVEVLRGPQGTLYGRSATAGVLSFHTRDPKLDEWETGATAEIANYDLRHYTGAFNLPISDIAALRISADQYSRDGFYDRDGGHTNRTSGRLKLLVKPTDTLSVVLGAALQDVENNSGGRQGSYVLGEGVEYNNILPIVTGKNRFWQFWGDVKLQLGDVTVEYLPALRTWDQDAVQSSAGPALLPLRLLVKTPVDRFHTQELRFSGLIAQKLHWLGGVFYYNNKLHNTNDVRWASSGGLLASSDTFRRTENIGFYGDATYDIAPTWRLTGGLRWDYTKVQTEQTYTTNTSFLCNTPLAPTLADGNPNPDCPAGSGDTNAGLPETLVSASISGDAGKRTFRNFTFRARLEHDLTPHSLVYATVSSGFIPGDVQFGTGTNSTGQQVPVVRPYSAETLTSYEIGAKNRFFNGALQLNGDLFYYNYGGFQVQVNPNPIDPSAQFLVTVPARIWGAELEGVVTLSPDDRLRFGYTYVGSKLHDLPPEYTAAVSQDFVTGVPPHTINVNYDHTFHLGDNTLVVNAYGRYTSAYDRRGISPTFVSQLDAAGIDRDSLIRQKGLFIANLTTSLTLDGDKITISGYVRNVFDKRYATDIEIQSVSPAFNATASLSDPRTFGVIASFKF